MHSHEIPSSEWLPFLNDLSKRHQGEHVTVELIGRNIGDQTEARDQALLGMSIDSPTGSMKIDVIVGDSLSSNISHEIAHPVHVRLAQAEDGEDEALEIESDDGPCTLVRFMHDRGAHA
jgi:hypothetical protein